MAIGNRQVDMVAGQKVQGCAARKCDRVPRLQRLKYGVMTYNQVINENAHWSKGESPNLSKARLNEVYWALQNYSEILRAVHPFQVD